MKAKNTATQTEKSTMKTAKELEAGDAVQAGEIVAEVKSVRIASERFSILGADSIGEMRNVKYFTFDGQPEISEANLQSFIDQGSIKII